MGPLPLDNAIISAPLARNAKFHSPLLLSVRQSKLREGPRRPLGPPPAPHDPIQPLIPSETRSYTLIVGVFGQLLEPFRVLFSNHFFYKVYAQCAIRRIKIGTGSQIHAHVCIFILKSIILNQSGLIHAACEKEKAIFELINSITAPPEAILRLIIILNIGFFAPKCKSNN